MEVTRIDNVTRTYKIGKLETQALRGVSLSIESGEFTALVGPSGSGKTTLLQLIGCLDQPTSGHVYINGKDVSTLNRNQRADMRRGTIGFVFQFFALIPTLTAYENIEMPLLLVGQGAAERKARVNQLLEWVDLSDHAHHRPDQMSGGQQQRVAIARALATNPTLVLADEPTANLDSVTGTNILNLMKELNQSEKTTFIFSTHDARVWAYASAVVRLADGQIQDRVTAEEAVRAGGLPTGRPA
jgi:putative ABC transport system ATP-binding protein